MIIYVIETDGGTKVGFTEKDCIDSRLKSLQTGNAKVIKVLKIYIVKNPKKMETIIHYFLREYRVRGEFFNCSLEYINNIIEECIRLENLKDTFDSNDGISNILRENLEAGSKTDFVKLKDIKKLLKDNGFNKSLVSVKYIIQDLFPECTYYDRKCIEYKDFRNIFVNIKLKSNC
jgi:hypothetical protein